MISRLAASVFVIWTLGFFWFAVFLPQPADGVKTDAIVVPTGGAGRIDRGIELLREGRAKLLLVTGVDAEVAASPWASPRSTPRATPPKPPSGSRSARSPRCAW